jgi:type IV pilus assembly protein PilV
MKMNSAFHSKPIAGLQLARGRASAGFSLLEVLVAVVVVSVGLIGVASVQTTTLKLVQVSQQRSSASQYVQSMADRMRSNLAGVRAGNYVRVPTPTYAAIPGVLAGYNDCVNSCGPQQRAEADLRAWLNELAIALPGGRGVILGDPAQTHQITVMWEEKGLSPGLKAPCPLAVAEPPEVQCFSASFQP